MFRKARKYFFTLFVFHYCKLALLMMKISIQNQHSFLLSKYKLYNFPHNATCFKNIHCRKSQIILKIRKETGPNHLLVTCWGPARKMSLDEECPVSRDTSQPYQRPTYIRSKPMLGVIGKIASHNSEDCSLYRSLHLLYLNFIKLKFLNCFPLPPLRQVWTSNIPKLRHIST